MEKPIYTEIIGLYTINIYIDNTPTNPREWDNLGTLVAFEDHKAHYTIWESTTSYLDFLYSAGEIPNLYEEQDEEAENPPAPSLEELLHMEKSKSEIVWFPLDSTNNGYDDQIKIVTKHPTNHIDYNEPNGVICARIQDIKRNLQVTEISPEVRENVEDILQSEIKSLNQYISGECYGYVIQETNSLENEEIDSCWGFIGDYKYCLEEARSYVKSLPNQLTLPFTEKGA